MDADFLDRAWDPAAPGAGALRTTAIVQLYVRMTSHHPLTILVVDAMCLTFGADGVTVQELVDYLGITEDRVRFGLEGIPAEMRCTSQQLDADSAGIAVSSTASAGVKATGGGAAGDGSAGRRGNEKEVRYFLNYKRLLPLIYAHLTRLLLWTCVVDVPPCRYVETVKAAQLAPYNRTADGTAHAFFSTTASTAASAAQSPAPPAGASSSPSSSSPAPSPSPVPVDSTGEHVEVSDAMKRKSAIRGVYCLGCSCYFLVEEFYETLSRCPRCGKDALRLCIQQVHKQLCQRVAEQHTATKLLPAVSQVWKRRVATLSTAHTPTDESSTTAPPPAATGSSTAKPKPGAPSSAVQPALELNCPLAQDPFLLQQALAFLFLYASRFASVNDAATVVDVQEILTEPEYKERLRGKASLADQFRSRHRHAASVRVRVVSQREVDAARQAESHRKLLKRAMLPPWLRHTTALEALGGSHRYTRPSAHGATASVEETDATTFDVAAQETMSGGDASAVQPVKKTAQSTSSGGAMWTAKQPSSPPLQPGKRARPPPAAEAAAELTRAASFIAEHFYEDEYDEVALPLSRARR